MNQAIPVLMHHHITPHQGLVTVSPDVFERQICWLHKRGYHSLTCAEFGDFLQGKPVAPNSILITFDDGYLDNYLYAYPILKKYHMHAVLFIVTAWMGDGEPRTYDERAALCPPHRACMVAIKDNRMDQVMLRWSEVKSMQSDGTFEFHSHTHTHTRWDKHFANDRHAKREALLHDLCQAQNKLTEKLGQASEHLCWPQGYYDQDYIEVALKLGYRYLYTVEKHINDHTSDPLTIGRIVIKNKMQPWFGSRMWLYQRPILGKAYLALRGKK
jgi:peptidoglycan/xylan/chitin deacetylase (PgdA/CDA1 family)